MAKSFDLHEVAGGVWAAVAPSMAGPAVSNAAIIDLGDKTLVVDSFMTVRAADELRAEAKRLTGRDPFLVVNSHWHSDHVRGNRAFTDIPIVGTRQMVEMIIADAPKDAAEFRSRLETLTRAVDDARRAAESTSDEERAAGLAALADAMTAEAESYALTLPDLLIGERLEIEGERNASVLGYGRGHTVSDLFVHVPSESVVVAGDLVWTGVHPKTNDGFLADWAVVLDRIMQLDPEHVVSGHGPPGTAHDIAAMAEYIRAVDEIVAEVASGTLDVADVSPPPGSEEWLELPRFEGGVKSLSQRG